MERKKGIELNQAFGVVLTLILIGVLIVIAIVLFVNLSSGFSGTETVTVNNETGAINATGYTLSNSTACEFADVSITTATNATSGAVIAAGNYTVSTAGVVTNASAAIWPNANFTYSYTWGSEACDASDSMIGEFDNYTSLIGLVGTIIFLGLVIGVLVAAFAFGGKREV
jgi:hypothetical protein